MEKIQLEVDKVSEKVFSKLSIEGKKRLGLAVSVLLKKIANDKDYPEYQKFLDEMGQESVKLGLNQELLTDLLSSDD